MSALFSTSIARLFDRRFTSSRLEPILRFAPAAIYLAIIFTLSSIPGKDIQLAVSDKVAHFTEYFILVVLLMFGLAGLAAKRTSAWHFVLCWLFAALYAASDEYHQSFVPNRDSSVFDWLADAAGAAAALLVIAAALRQLRADE